MLPKSRAVTMSDFHYTFNVAKKNPDNDITIFTEYLQIKNMTVGTWRESVTITS